MPDRLVTVDRDGDVQLIGVDRAAKRKAWDRQVVRQVAEAYELLGDSDARVGVLFGHGDHFSAGLDLADILPAVQRDGPSALSGGTKYDPFGLWGPPVPQPIVLAVQGIAYTLSIELALARCATRAFARVACTPSGACGDGVGDRDCPLELLTRREDFLHQPDAQGPPGPRTARR